ncbi:MAG: sigma 54-interacting transcriptional regulator [Bacteriovoracaceae bacterium]|nr:sigma 54-interacting transcriptional regulator [Bacteriovoracaceae bacterium]
MSNKTILLIEDDDLTFMLVSRLIPKKYEVVRAKKISEVEKIINDKKIFLGLVDLDLEYALEGLDILKILKRKDIKSVILSARNDKTIIHEAFKIGAIEFLQKPLSEKIFNQILIAQELKSSKVFNNEEELLQQMHQAVISPQPLLITGETGVGKTKSVHEFFQLWKQVQFEQIERPFVHVNCSEFSESLLESELFGHLKGSFTGATKDKLGLLEVADGGILFLDEIGTMSLSMQKKLLKAIEEQCFYPVGSEKPKHVSFKLVSATCESLEEKVKNGQMRDDFFHRISGFRIHLKPLRERVREIPKFIEEYIVKNRRNIIVEEEALEILKSYSWPGNIRELSQILDKLFLLESRLIDAQCVRETLNLLAPGQGLEKEIDDDAYIEAYGLVKFIEKKEKEILEKYLDKNLGKIRKTIEELKISPSVFYRIKGDM